MHINNIWMARNSHKCQTNHLLTISSSITQNTIFRTLELGGVLASPIHPRSTRHPDYAINCPTVLSSLLTLGPPARLRVEWPANNGPYQGGTCGSLASCRFCDCCCLSMGAFGTPHWADGDFDSHFGQSRVGGRASTELLLGSYSGGIRSYMFDVR